MKSVMKSVMTLDAIKLVCCISLSVIIWLAHRVSCPCECQSDRTLNEVPQKLSYLDSSDQLISRSQTSRNPFSEKTTDTDVFVNKNLKYEISELVSKTQYVKGPMQDDELLLMFALVRVIRPRTIVEFGFNTGVSSRNWLRASPDPRFRLYAWDIAERSKRIAEQMSKKDKRLIFTQGPQEEFDPQILGGRKIDIALLDAGHTFISQKALWAIMEPILSANSLVIVHDTGRHVFDMEIAASQKRKRKPIYTPKSCENWNIELDAPNRCSCRCDGVSDGIGYCCSRTTKEEERIFVKYVYTNFPLWRPIHLQSFRFWRHGVTILQKGRLGLPTEEFLSELNIF